MSAIKNIIFDLGGVFIEVDYKKTEQAFIDLGVTNFNDFYRQEFSSPLFEDLEVGKITPEQFYNALKNITQINATNKEIEIAWNAILGQAYTSRLLWLKEIRNKYKVFLFSNTNIIHHQCFTKIFEAISEGKDFDANFIKAYYSNFCGFRKPELASYNKILKEQSLIASETLFIDDTLSNIEGARLAGLQTIHLLSDMNLETLDL